MTEFGSAKVLLLGSDDPAWNMRKMTLQAVGYEVSFMNLGDEDIDEKLENVLDRSFQAIVIAYRRRAVVLGRLLSSIRSRMSPNHEAGVVVMADRLMEDEAKKLIGRGVNRVLSLETSNEDLISAVESTIKVAPRVELRTSVELEISLPQRVLQTLGQTENLSESGMLVRGFHHYPAGTEFRFRLMIPGSGLVIQGEAEITRQTDLSRERLKGFGARFTELDPESKKALEEALTETFREGLEVN